jgi:uncharacterized YigZ family protein
MRTLAGDATTELEIRRSRFRAHAARVDTVAAADVFLQSVADLSATHNCWAWKIGDQYRFNDDGEPAGTAGRPILGAIEGKGLEHTMVVVTRWFGGIKLGAGGLVRAYAGAAARCLDLAGIIEEQPLVDCTIEAGFAWTGPVYAALESCRAEKLTERFGDTGIRLHARLPEPALEELRALLRDATRGEAVVRKLAGS